MRTTALALGLLVLQPGLAGAVFLNELMANPGALDWNQDGVADFAADEYVELVNRDVREVDLSGWTLSDEVGVRHTFGFSILPPGGTLVIFGGGALAGFPGFAVAASSGALALNNTGDTITLADGEATVVDSVTFGAPTAGTSINRSPDGTPGVSFALHDAVAGAAGTGSPGLRVDQSPFAAPPLALPFINEWLPDPNGNANDWNGDGFATDDGDEFVEIRNPPSGGSIDLAGWTLRDGASTYHTFAPGTVLAPGAAIVVVAGAPVGIPGLAVQGTSWGSISNTFDDLYLEDDAGEVVSHVRHAATTPDLSWNRDPDGEVSTPFFALHGDLAPSRASSPGLAADGSPFPVPEPRAIALAALATLGGLRFATARQRAARRPSCAGP